MENGKMEKWKNPATARQGSEERMKETVRSKGQKKFVLE
jgi:hypothetical protein